MTFSPETVINFIFTIIKITFYCSYSIVFVVFVTFYISNLIWINILRIREHTANYNEIIRKYLIYILLCDRRRRIRMTMHIFNCDWSWDLTIIWSTYTQTKALINPVVNSNLIEIRYSLEFCLWFIYHSNTCGLTLFHGSYLKQLISDDVTNSLSIIKHNGYMKGEENVRMYMTYT